MIEALESRYRVEECNFNAISVTFDGHKIYAKGKVAEKIEKQTSCTMRFTPWMSVADLD